MDTSKVTMNESRYWSCRPLNMAILVPLNQISSALHTDFKVLLVDTKCTLWLPIYQAT